ncbi:MAG: M20/M25/M40 family metallo-hydrolase, partial [Oscillospiraceae bacterium]
DKEKFEARKRFISSVGEFINNKYGKNTVQVVTHDQYFNMREQILPHIKLIELAEKAMKAEGVTPEISPIRGGTDGARLSYMGLPCPNLCTGGLNFHGPFEYCSLDSMEKIARVLIRLTEIFAKEMTE